MFDLRFSCLFTLSLMVLSVSGCPTPNGPFDAGGVPNPDFEFDLDAGGDAGQASGEEGGACDEDGTCNNGLLCVEGVCRRGAVDGGAGQTATDGGPTGDAGPNTDAGGQEVDSGVDGGGVVDAGIADAGPLNTGSVVGSVCTPDGTSYLGGIQVVIAVEGDIYSATSDNRGQYSLDEVPIGQHRIQVHRGLFSATVDVAVSSNETTFVPSSACALSQPGRVAVLPSAFEDVSPTLTAAGIDGVEVVDEQQRATLLSDYELLRQFDVLVFGCSSVVDEMDFLDSLLMQQNLRSFVENGGHVYASDQAYDLIEVSFPSAIEFLHNDTFPEPQRAQWGLRMDEPASLSVVSPALSTHLDSSLVRVQYPLARWAAATAVGTESTVLLRGDADVRVVEHFSPTDEPLAYEDVLLEDIPHAVLVEVGEGSILYTSFHAENETGASAGETVKRLLFEL